MDSEFCDLAQTVANCCDTLLKPETGALNDEHRKDVENIRATAARFPEVYTRVKDVDGLLLDYARYDLLYLLVDMRGYAEIILLTKTNNPNQRELLQEILTTAQALIDKVNTRFHHESEN